MYLRVEDLMLHRRDLLVLPFAPLLRGAEGIVRFGMVTDIHHADKDSTKTRFYRSAKGRLEKAVREFASRKLDFAISLGDFIDSAPTVEGERQNLVEINSVFKRLSCPRHYVLGNHCVYNLTKAEYLAGVERERSYYAFDRGGVRFLVLDGCFRKDGVDYGRQNYDWRDTSIPEKEIAWLRGELGRGRGPVVVFVHQRLDRVDDVGIKNSPVVREMLEKSGRVQAVFQGHSHENDRTDINGITYLTMAAIIEQPDPAGGAHSVVEIGPGRMVVEGFGRQAGFVAGA